jgi:hypothetical protein
VFLCKVNTLEVCYLLKNKCFDDAPFNPCPIVNHWFKISKGSSNMIHPPILKRITHFSFVWEMCKEMLHWIEKPERKKFLHLA